MKIKENKEIKTVDEIRQQLLDVTLIFLSLTNTFSQKLNSSSSEEEASQFAVASSDMAVTIVFGGGANCTDVY